MWPKISKNKIGQKIVQLYNQCVQPENKEMNQGILQVNTSSMWGKRDCCYATLLVSRSAIDRLLVEDLEAKTHQK